MSIYLTCLITITRIFIFSSTEQQPMIILPIFQRNRRDSLQRKQNSRMLQFPSINGHRLQIIFSVFRSHCFHLANRDVGRFHRHARGKKHDRLNRETKKRSFERPSSHVRKHSWAEKKSWNKCQIYANVQQRSRYIAKHILEKFIELHLIAVNL